MNPPNRTSGAAPLFEPLEPRLLLDAVPVGLRITVAPPSTGYQPCDPGVAMDADGDFVVVWDIDLGAPFPSPVKARLFDATGAPKGSAFGVPGGQSTHSAPAVAMDADGDFVVAWAGFAVPLYAQRFSPSGSPVGSRITVAVPQAHFCDPGVAMDADGDFVVVWDRTEGLPDPDPVQARLFDATGVPRSGVFELPGSLSMWCDPAVAMDADGDFVVVWSGSTTGPLYAQRFTPSGSPVGLRITVAAGAGYYPLNHGVAMDADGDFVVVWERDDGHHSPGPVEACLFDATGVPQSGVFEVPGSRSTWCDPAVAMDADGDFVVVWSDGSEGPLYAQRFAQPKAWTVMVYLDGDTNDFMERAAIEDFLEMAQVHNSDVNVVVQFDRAIGHHVSNPDWTNTKRFLVWENITPEPQYALEDLPEQNMGDPDTLEDFIDWSRTRYPADRYALVLWDHGGGWKDGVCVDKSESPADWLTMSDLRQALHGATDGGADRLDVIGMDACLMAGLEVAYEIADYGDLFVASAETAVRYGWVYDDILLPAHLGFGTGAETWAEYLVTSYSNDWDLFNSNLTLMAADLDHVGGLAADVAGLADLLTANLEDERPHIAAAWDASRRYTDKAGDTQFYRSFVDVHDFCEELAARSANPAVQAQAGALMSAVTGSLLEAWWKDTGYAGTTDGQRSFSVYFPADETDWRYDDYDGAHLSFLADPHQHWDEFLKMYFNTPPEITLLLLAPYAVVRPNNATLTAGAADSDGDVVSVAFYCETNAAEGLQTGAGGDGLIGTDLDDAAGWTCVFGTGGMPAGIYTYYAQATDDDGAVSTALSVSGWVVEPDTWSGDDNSDWDNPRNWFGGTVPGPPARVTFGRPATHQPTLADDQAVGGAGFLTPGWTIAGESSTLTVGSGGIDSVGAGTNTVEAGVVLSADSTWTIAPGNTLHLAGGLDGGTHDLTKDGGGTLIINGAENLGTFTIEDGVVRLMAGGTSVLVTEALAIDPTDSVLDLTDSYLIVDYPADGPSPFDEIAAWIASGCNGGAWDGFGITSSAAAADPRGLTAVGVIDNGDTETGIGGLATFGGVAVDETSVLAACTWWGDINLDGVVDSNDYDRIDTNYVLWIKEGRVPDGGFRWAVGDLDYDNMIDSNDYDLIDNAFLLQDEPAAAGGAASLAGPDPLPLVASSPKASDLTEWPEVALVAGSSERQPVAHPADLLPVLATVSAASEVAPVDGFATALVAESANSAVLTAWPPPALRPVAEADRAAAGDLLDPLALPALDIRL